MSQTSKGNSRTILTERELASMVRVGSASDGRGRPLDALIAGWAAREPVIRRVWIRAAPAAGPLSVALELQPVADSEETAAQWLGRSAGWRVGLGRAIGRAVELEWIDPDDSLRRAEKADTLVYERGG